MSVSHFRMVVVSSIPPLSLSLPPVRISLCQLYAALHLSTSIYIHIFPLPTSISVFVSSLSSPFYFVIQAWNETIHNIIPLYIPHYLSVFAIAEIYLVSFVSIKLVRGDGRGKDVEWHGVIERASRMILIEKSKYALNHIFRLNHLAYQRLCCYDGRYCCWCYGCCCSCCWIMAISDASWGPNTQI